MTSKYNDMATADIEKYWKDFVTLVAAALKEDWESINILPEESYALCKGIAHYMGLYIIGVTYQVFPNRPELADESVFHGIIIELRDGYENDKMVTLDRPSYHEFAHCVRDLCQYGMIAMAIAQNDKFGRQDEL